MKIIKKLIYRTYIHLRVYRIHAYFTNKKLISKAKEKGGLKLHLGCGHQILDGWVNIDAKPMHPEIIVMNLPKGLKRFGDNTVRYIYAAHLLEHLEYPKVALATAKECHRILTAGGVLRIVVPGIERIIRAYVQDDQAFFKVQEQMHPAWCTTKLEHLIYALQYNGHHKYGYDFETLSKLLSQTGFVKLVNSDYNQSQIEDLKIDYRGENLSLFVDAIK